MEIEDFNETNSFRHSIYFKGDHVDFLKRVDKDNMSRAVRIVINNFIKQKKLLNFEKYLSTFAFGLVLVGIGTILPNVFIGVSTIATGSFCIIYSLIMYTRGRLQYERGMR